jgi:hypothetical protein
VIIIRYFASGRISEILRDLITARTVGVTHNHNCTSFSSARSPGESYNRFEILNFTYQPDDNLLQTKPQYKWR